MTEAQKNTIYHQKKSFDRACDMYQMYLTDDCKFRIYKSFNDPNITLVITTIESISDNFQPYFKRVYLLVEPDGNLVNLLDFYSMDYVLEYTSKLHKIV
jgi:hypothetical protein